MKKYLVFLVALFIVVPTVNAKEINHFTSKMDNEITLSDNYNASAVVAGDEVNIDGNIKGISVNAANQFKQKGTSDYAVIAGNVVDFSGTVNNDAFIFGNIVTLNDETNINRDAIIAGSDVEISGTFNRNISIYAEKVTFKNANVKGNVKIYGAQINVKKDTIVAGFLSYPEDSTYKADKGAKISEVKKTDAIQKESEDNFFITLTAKVWSFLCLILVFAAISLLFPKALNKINNKYEKADLGNFVEVFTKGLIALILVPVISILLVFSQIGLPLGVILLIFYGIAMYLTTVFTAYLVGYKLWQRVFNKDAHVLLIGLFGLFILFICSIIPGIRILVSILTTLIGLGLIVELVKPNRE